MNKSTDDKNSTNAQLAYDRMLCAGLSEEMKRGVRMAFDYGKLIRYDGGFWHKENAELKPLRNGGDIVGYYPEGYLGTNTIKSLLKRGIFIATKFKDGYMGKEYPVECALAKACA